MSELTEKIIIENRTSKPMHTLMPYVQHALEMGRVSDNGKSYCYCAAFEGLYISARRNKASDTFIAWENDRG